MIFLKLFLTFLKIGAVSFGGGYAMISLIREECLAAGWLTEEELLNFIAVAESTPGPVAINMATFIGSSQGGVAGAALATLGVVLPSFIIITIIAAIMHNLLKYEPVKAFLGGLRPAVVALIVGTATTMLFGAFVGIKKIGDAVAPDFRVLIIIAVAATITLIYKKLRKKTFSPILLILISGIMGILLYGS